MGDLAAIFDKHRSDKEWYHHYSEFYEALFLNRRPAITSVLELGIYQGGSLLAWADYFPNAVIQGVDLVLPPISHPHVTMWAGDATDPAVLAGPIGAAPTVPAFDLIVDDASHFIGDQLRSLLELWPHLTPGGFYVIEDHVDPAHLYTLQHLPGAEVLAFNAQDRGSLVVVRK